MSLATRCPVCQALFKVSADQLRLRSGQVRCGRCNAVFDGLEHLASTSSDAVADVAEQGSPTAMESLDFVVDAQIAQASAVEQAHAASASAPAETDAITDYTSVAAPAQEHPEHAFAEAEPARSAWRGEWKGIAAGVLLALLLLAQVGLRHRDQLAAEHPALRPVLAGLCTIARCDLKLPRQPERLSIEGDEMIAADPRTPGRVTLIATLRNSAPFAVAYPALELSLQGAGDEVLARRVLAPAEYLETGTAPADGLPAHSELNLRLALDTGPLRPEGYRVLLFYPEGT